MIWNKITLGSDYNLFLDYVFEAEGQCSFRKISVSKLIEIKKNPTYVTFEKLERVIF